MAMARDRFGLFLTMTFHVTYDTSTCEIAMTDDDLDVVHTTASIDRHIPVTRHGLWTIPRIIMHLHVNPPVLLHPHFRN